MKLFIIITVFLIHGSFAVGQAQTCEVLMASIEGTYVGQCSGKEANGEGKSIGTDSYEGTFKIRVKGGNYDYKV
ncbi:MAG: hypothetical protein ABI741_09445 [Ferruginibacter sp.]